MRKPAKCIVLILLTLLFSACKGATGKMIEVKDDPMPVKVMYHQMWESYAEGESTDPELIRLLLNQLNSLKIGEKTNMAFDDFGDRIIFEYSDGTQKTYYFEGDIFVMEDGTRYKVEGVDSLRDILSPLIPEEY